MVLLLYGGENHRFGNATRCVAGKKIKGRGGKIIKGYGIIYTPEQILIFGPFNLFSFISFVGYKRILPITDKICWSPEIR